MKKLSALLFSILLLSSSSVFAQEDLSKVNINNLKRLSSNEIIDAFNNIRSEGYFSREIYEIDNFKFTEFTYANGDFDHFNKFVSVSGKWKVYDNKICLKATKNPLTGPEKMFTCALVYSGVKKGEYYFYQTGLGVYAKTYAAITLIE